MKREKFGKDLVTARENKGYNSAQLANKLNVSANAVHKWENGLSFPRPDKWQDIKRVTGLSSQEYRNEESERLLNPSDVMNDNLDDGFYTLLHNFALSIDPVAYKKILSETPKFKVPLRLWNEILGQTKTVRRAIKFEAAGVEKPKSIGRAPLPTDNKHLKDISKWIGQQNEPEIYWAELKRHLIRIEPDFHEYLKKQQD